MKGLFEFGAAIGKLGSVSGSVGFWRDLSGSVGICRDQSGSAGPSGAVGICRELSEILGKGVEDVHEGVAARGVEVYLGRVSMQP